MVVMLMFFYEMLKLVPADGLIRGMDLCFRPGKDLFRLDAVHGVLYEFAVLHHALYIVGYPGLFFRTGGHAHITEKLLFGKRADIVGRYFDVVLINDLVDDERPFELVYEAGEFLLYFGMAFGFFAAGLHPSFQEIFREFNFRLIEQDMIQRVL